MYLPLYNSPESLEIGVEAGATVEPLPKRQEKPIVVYGTSIMHGASAARCGMAFPAQLGRRLGTPVINLGFAGNGRMHPEVVDLLAEFDPSVFVIDCLPNMAADLVAERTIPLVHRLRRGHADTPMRRAAPPPAPSTSMVSSRSTTQRQVPGYSSPMRGSTRINRVTGRRM